ncbi:hypothetical protein [uncultured Ruminococcus sp.]|uniref:hypothetical protein n=1 Tax=uncultured Ruminococcus sp. TaxID=165186 RepID=UPI0025D43353|nr:hypothetical protein [uncultured Ruminococcus sp.]
MAKRIFERFKKLNKKKKIQLVTAAVLTMALLVALPLYAWFTHTRSIAMTTQINAPTQLYITAGNKESVANLEMGNIDVESGTYKDFVFGVSGKDVSKYQIQLAHTTNIPFTYTIYRAQSANEGVSDAVEYYSKEEGRSYYYTKGDVISGEYLNQSSSSEILANKSLHSKSYDEYGNVQKHAEALYWQSVAQAVENGDSKGFVDYFIVRVSWEGQTVENNKETDMVYLTVQRSAS